MEFYKTKIRPWIGIVVLIGIGIFMISDPTAMDGNEVHGRNALLKSILKAIWGLPAGILLLLVGLVLGFFQFKKSDDPEEG